MDYEVIFCIVNAGYSELVMDAAKEVGARGGTVLHAKAPPIKKQNSFSKSQFSPIKKSL